MAKFIGDIPFVMHTTNHQSLISTMPDHHTDNSSNRALDQLNNRVPNQLDNRALKQPLNQFNNKQPTDTASAQVQKRPAEQAYPNKRSKISNKTFDYWHRFLGHSSKIDHKLYDDGHLIPSIPADFTCEACIMAKSTNAVPAELKPGSRTT